MKLMSACKTIDERRFYMELAIKERYSVRELERQIDSGYYERYSRLIDKVSNRFYSNKEKEEIYILDKIDRITNITDGT